MENRSRSHEMLSARNPAHNNYLVVPYPKLVSLWIKTCQEVNGLPPVRIGEDPKLPEFRLRCNDGLWNTFRDDCQGHYRAWIFLVVQAGCGYEVVTCQDIINSGRSEGLLEPKENEAWLKIKWTAVVIHHNRTRRRFQSRAPKSIFTDDENCERASSYYETHGGLYHFLPGSTIALASDDLTEDFSLGGQRQIILPRAQFKRICFGQTDDLLRMMESDAEGQKRGPHCWTRRVGA